MERKEQVGLFKEKFNCGDRGEKNSYLHRKTGTRKQGELC